jgi:hypothetical protein
MNTNNHITESSKKSSRTKDLSLILELLGSNLESLLDSVDVTKKVHKLGTKTELHQQIENVFKDPLKAVWEVSSKFDEQILLILNTIVESYFKKHNEIIHSVYKTKTSGNDLHFSVVLKEDSLENRNTLLTFFDRYDLTEYSKKYPIFFQFVPLELINKINTEKKIF